MEEDEEEDGIGIMQYNEVRALVNRYVGAMKAFDKMQSEIDVVNNMIGQINLSKLSFNCGYNDAITSKADFSKLLQKRSWNYIFDKMNMQKYVTSGVMEDINKFVETQTKVPFTMRNIYKMLQIIDGTRQESYNRALEEAVDNFTKHSHDNRFGVEGWKTNSGHMLNKKFICEGVVEISYGGRLEVRYSSYNSNRLDDLTKVLCNITGKNYSDIGTLHRFNYDKEHNSFPLETNTWYKWGFFEMKFFKKGTAHIRFKDIDTWYRLNKAYGELKGFSLPETYKA